MIPRTIDYKILEEIIKPHEFTIRETPEPLELHYLGEIVRRFPSKTSLVDYLNMKIYGVMGK